jgi:hypothetical protein
MFDQPLDWFHSAVKALSHGDALASAGVTMWLLTVCGILLRRVPRLIYMKIRSKLIVRMTLDKSSGNAPADPAVKNFNAFLRWFDTLPSSRFDRNRRSVFSAAGNVTFVPGLGFHWFFHAGRYYWFRYEELESQGIEYQKERITIFTFGVSLKPLNKLVDAFAVKPDTDWLKVYSPNINSRTTWEIVGSIPIKNHPALIVNPNVQAEVFDRVDEFMVTEDWYRERGLAYKMTILLMGPPGTGKTSIAREIAIRHNLRFHEINLAMLENGMLKRAVASMKPGVLLIDDFEETPSLHRRVVESSDDESEPTSFRSGRGSVSLSTFLSVLDGAIPLDNVIIVLATNHPEKLDPAIYRPGRVDYNVVVREMEEPQVRAYIQRMYGEEYTGPVKEVTIAVLAAIFNRNKHSLEDFSREYLAYQQGILNLGKLEYTGALPVLEVEPAGG